MIVSMQRDPSQSKKVYSFWNKENPVERRGLCYNRAMKTNDIVYGVYAVTEALLANTGKQTLSPDI